MTFRMMTWPGWYKRGYWAFFEPVFSKKRELANKNKIIPFESFCFQAPFFFNSAFFASWDLKYGDEVPMPEPRDRWLSTRILSNSFSYREPVGRASPVERLEVNNAPLSKLLRQAVFPYHVQGDRLTIYPCSILRTRIQKNEASWANIRFESKIQSTKIYKKWAIEVLSV